MIYALLIALLTAGLYAESAMGVTPSAEPLVAGIAFVLTFLAIFVPRRFFAYKMEDVAPTVLQRLMQRAAIGTAFVIILPIITLVLLNTWRNPVL